MLGSFYTKTMWEQFFKSEIRKSGQKYIDKQLASASSPSEMEITGFVSSYRVSFKTSSVQSPSFLVTCSCSASKKGQLCKHSWAVLDVAIKKFPDFFHSKREILSPTKQAPTENTYKLKQAEYRKSQYQKMKQFKKALGKDRPLQPQFPFDVQKALDYFDSNGFAFEAPLNEDQVQLAKKKLSRVFHPDLGGSHGEIIQLNQNWEILISFLKR